MKSRIGCTLLVFLCIMLGFSPVGLSLSEEPLWVAYQGKEGPGKGKHIVLVSGDEEYRSEEALPMLGRILAEHHGFHCTVLFAIDSATGEINPNIRDNIPGIEHLASADLMIIATRFRNLPDDQMKYVVDYLEQGKPVIGLRTATHAFDIPPGRTYSRYSWNSREPGWEGGFGRVVLGETWIAHHGDHNRESTRGIIAPGMETHPIVRGCEDIWGPTDVYRVRLPLPEDSVPLVLGQVLEGMLPTDKPVVGPKNDPLMPIAWTKTYEIKEGHKGRVFTTTMGAAVDFKSEGLRRLVVNAAYWCLGLEEQIPERAKVDYVGAFDPNYFGFNGFKKGLKPRHFASDTASTF